MSRFFRSVLLGVTVFFLFPGTAPAPLVYREGEGWSYEPVGGRKWLRQRAKDQVEVAQAAFDRKDYSTAAKAANRTVRVWPASDYAPQAQYLLGRSLQAQGQDERAFDSTKLPTGFWPENGSDFGGSFRSCRRCKKRRTCMKNW